MKYLPIILLFICAVGYSQSASVKIDGPTGQVSDLAAISTTEATDLIIIERNDSSKKIIHAEFSVLIDNVFGDSVVWDDIRVPAQNTKINPLASEPAFESWQNGLFAFHFDPANDSTNSLHFSAQLPHSYKEGTDLCAHIHWSPKTTNEGSVVWKLEYTIISINGTFASSDTLICIDPADGTAFKHQFEDLGDISGTGLTISAMLVGRLTRAGDHTSATFTGDAVLLEIDFHYQLNTVGSQQENVK